MTSLPVGKQAVKTKDADKHVEPKAEDLRTRVQFPPPPPITKPQPFSVGVFSCLITPVDFGPLLAQHAFLNDFGEAATPGNHRVVNAVFVVENLQTGLAFDDLPEAVVIMRLGYAVDVLG